MDNDYNNQSPQHRISRSSNSPTWSKKKKTSHEGIGRNSISISPRIERISIKSMDNVAIKDKLSYSNVSPKDNNTKDKSSLISTSPIEKAALVDAIKKLTENVNSFQHEPIDNNKIEKISTMSKLLTDEANALSDSLKQLSDNISETRNKTNITQEDLTNFPYHLFLIEIIINKIHMKCECFETDYNNLVITATFLGKRPVVLYDSSFGKIADFSRINTGKSSLFAMTYDKICSIETFIINLELLKQPPCSHCITKLAEAHMDYTKEFKSIKQELCEKWSKEKPDDDIICTTSSPLHKNQFYLTCSEEDNFETIGIIEVSLRMSFLGKEITTVFSTASDSEGTSLLLKEDNGISMYSCQNVEMDDGGKILLDEKKFIPLKNNTTGYRDFQNTQLLNTNYGVHSSRNNISDCMFIIFLLLYL